MPNVLATPTLFTRLFLMNLGGYLNTASQMSTKVSDKFGNADKEGHKPGDTVYVPKPQRFAVTDGLAYQGQNIENVQTPVKVDQVKGVHFQWDAVEKALSLNEIDNLYAKPAALAMSSTINSLAAAWIAKRTANNVGTPGTAPTSMLTYLSAADKLIALGLPEQEKLTAIISRKMGSTYIAAQAATFNPTSLIGGQTLKGAIGEQQLGYSWKTDQTLYRHTYGVQTGTPLTGSSSVSTTQTADGGDNAEMTLVTDGWTSGGATLNEGDKFTVAGTYAVHPQTKVSTGELKQFTVRATVSDTTGDMSVVIYPAMTPTGVYANVTQGAANNSAIVLAGASGVVSEQAIVMHKNAYAFASVPLKVPQSGESLVKSHQQTDPDTGLTASFITYFDADQMIWKNRLDCLFGFGNLYREMACIVSSS